NDRGTGSLRAAIGSAAPGDTITFALNYPAAIKLSGDPLKIEKNLTISGPGASYLTISGENSTVVFLVSATATISGVTIQRGSYSFGNCIFNSGNLTLTDSVVSACG